MKKRSLESASTFSLPETDKKLTGKEYLANLRKLKQFLKDNPEQRKLYSDMNIDFLILQAKQQIMLEEEKKENEQIRLCPDGFRFTSENPF